MVQPSKCLQFETRENDGQRHSRKWPLRRSIAKPLYGDIGSTEAIDLSPKNVRLSPFGFRNLPFWNRTDLACESSSGTRRDGSARAPKRRVLHSPRSPSPRGKVDERAPPDLGGLFRTRRPEPVDAAKIMRIDRLAFAVDYDPARVREWTAARAPPADASASPVRLPCGYGESLCGVGRTDRPPGLASMQSFRITSSRVRLQLGGSYREVMALPALRRGRAVKSMFLSAWPAPRLHAVGTSRGSAPCR